jgi:hypothetical protein
MQNPAQGLPLQHVSVGAQGWFALTQLEPTHWPLTQIWPFWQAPQPTDLLQPSETMPHWKPRAAQAVSADAGVQVVAPGHWPLTQTPSLHIPQFTSPPQPSETWPHMACCAGHAVDAVAGVQLVGTDEHWPPTQLWPGWQIEAQAPFMQAKHWLASQMPQLIVSPQPSGAAPQV